MHLLVLDIDGVLIDASRSFPLAVTQALAQLRPELSWSEARFRALKRAGGFNNDFRLTAGAMALFDAGGLARLDTATVNLSDLERQIQALEPEATHAVRLAHAHTRALELPLITHAELQALRGYGAIAVLTGRPPPEAALAWEVLGFELPGVVDSAPHLRKPAPGGLLQLARDFGASAITFVGDTRDDAECLRAARLAMPELTWRFAAVGPHRNEITRPGDLSAETLRALLKG